MKKYLKALNSLYGDTCQLPATLAIPNPRSSNLDKPRKPRRNREAGAQMKLVAWALEQRLPILSIPNEGNRGQLATHRLKQMGLRPGASDLLLFRRSCCGRWPGYWIEMKAPGEKPRPNQIAFMEDARKEGYRAEWFDDWLLARQSIEEYLGIIRKF